MSTFKIFKILLCAFMGTAMTAASQTPERISYQAVLRNASNNLLTDQSVRIRVSILPGSVNATAVYSEIHTVTTNSQGVFQIAVGGGTATLGRFSEINWSNGTFFLKSEVDPTGGNNYTISGTTQLLSVPYAMHARTADTARNLGMEKDPRFDSSIARGITAIDTSRWNAKQNRLTAGIGISISGNTISSTATTGGFSRNLGERFGGGVVFHVWRDSTGQERGLVVALTDQSDNYEWSNVQTTSVGPASKSFWDGMSNSNAIVSQQGHTKSAAKLCLDLVSGGQSDWYLPSVSELRLLYNNLFNVNRALSKVQGAQQMSYWLYWSSTEEPDSNETAFCISFFDGRQYENTKDGSVNPKLPVRAIRMF